MTAKQHAEQDQDPGTTSAPDAHAGFPGGGAMS